MSNGKIVRVALYIRVSTEEQVLHGYSLEAQETTLVEYAEQRGYKVIGIYRDEGFSARKSAVKRVVMQELLKDVEARKIDLILFTKLDRWFRSVGDYHTVQRVLEKNKVAWRAVLEDYNTETADGRLKVNIMLSVAENEADRTGERIRFVYESRIQRGEAPFPTRTAPYGYMVEIIDGKRKLVKNPETQEITEYFFRQTVSRSIRYAGEVTNKKYGLQRAYRQWHGMATNPAYYGTYHGVENYCEPYITKAEFDRINDNPQQIRKAQQNRVYLFTGLIRCGHCGRRMTARYSTSHDGTEYMYYRCQQRLVGLCTTRALSEIKIERYMLDNVRAEMERQLVDYEVAQATPKQQKKKADVSKLQERLRRVNVSYQAGNMTDAEYLDTTAEIQAAIADAQKADKDEGQKFNPAAIRAFLDSDFDTLYATLSRDEKRALWCSIIDHITLTDHVISDITFRA